jgi:hypothetical protein
MARSRVLSLPSSCISAISCVSVSNNSCLTISHLLIVLIRITYRLIQQETKFSCLTQTASDPGYYPVYTGYCFIATVGYRYRIRLLPRISVGYGSQISPPSRYWIRYRIRRCRALERIVRVTMQRVSPAAPHLTVQW